MKPNKSNLLNPRNVVIMGRNLPNNTAQPENQDVPNKFTVKDDIREYSSNTTPSNSYEVNIDNIIPNLAIPSAKYIADFAEAKYKENLITIDAIINSFSVCMKNAVGDFFKQRLQTMEISDFEDVYPPYIFNVVEEVLINILTPFNSKPNLTVKESAEYITRYLCEFVSAYGIEISTTSTKYKSFYSTIRYFCSTLERMRESRNVIDQSDEQVQI